MFGFGPVATFLVIAVVALISGIKILKEYERGVVFRLGRMVGARGPGIVYIIPGIEKMVKMDLRTVTMDIPPQDVITRDNVSVKVNAVLYFRVIDPNLAVREVENYLFATSQLAQVTLRSVCGQGELDELLSEREKINSRIQDILDKQTDPWGIKVVLVELKHIDLPQEMQRAMAKQAEAERERRGKVISAEGEYQASTKLAAAAEIIQQFPGAMQLRYLQTVVEIAAENNSTTLFPIPIELFTSFVAEGKPASEDARARALKAAAESMIAALPETDDAATLETAARRMIATATKQGRERQTAGGTATDE